MLITKGTTVYMIGFKSSGVKAIFSNEKELELIAEQAINAGTLLDVNSLKQLNNYGRFTRPFNIQNWVLYNLTKNSKAFEGQSNLRVIAELRTEHSKVLRTMSFYIPNNATMSDEQIRIEIERQIDLNTDIPKQHTGHITFTRP